MSKIIPVRRCRECPHVREEFKNPSLLTCFVDLNRIRGIENVGKFPSWCPLDDAPEEESDGEA